MDNHPSGIKLESWLVSAGRPTEPGAPLNVPLIPASNFIIGSGREYSRDDGTPTWEALEEVVGGLESGRAVAFASGMAAIAAVFDQLSAGAVVVLPDDCYQGVAGLAAAGRKKSLVGAARGGGRYGRLDPRLRRRRPDLARIALEPAAHCGGLGGYLRGDTQARSDSSDGQHLRHAFESAARLRRHGVSAICDQVHRRPLRPIGGGRHDERRRAPARPQEVSRVDRRDTGDARSL